MTAVQLSLTDAIAARDRGAALAEQAVDEGWRDRAWRAIQQLAASGQPFTSEDLRRLAGDPDGHPNACGAVFLRAAKAGLIVRAGWATYQRREAHAHVGVAWMGAKA